MKVNKRPKRVPLDKEMALSSIVAELEVDKAPRILEKDGRAVAALISIEDLDAILPFAPSDEDVRRSLASAGAWSDAYGEALIDDIYRWRHESPPSPPVDL